MARHHRYNPWADLRSRPQVRLAWRPPEIADALGTVDPDTGEIVIAPGLTFEERRCTIAHELAHLDRGDTGHDPDHPDAWRYELRDEEATEQLAARRLIWIDDLIDALAPGHDWCRVAAELEVDLTTLFARMRGMSDRERAYVWAELDRREAGLPWA